MKLKGILSLLLSSVLTASCCFGVYAADADNDSEPDIYDIILSDSAYQTASQVLNALGIAEPNEDPEMIEGSVTRAEFTLMLSKIVGMENMGSTETVSRFYSDIDEDSYASAAIAAMTESDCVSGYEGKFYPDDNLLYEDAVCAVVNLLGYKNYAVKAGGYPIGYISQAAQLSLLDNVSGRAGDVISLRNVTKLIYNSLDADICKITAYGENNRDKYEVIKDRTILIDKRSIYKGKGIVTGNYMTNLLTPETSISKDSLEIGGYIYTFSEDSIQYEELNSAAALLGYETEYYYISDRISGEEKLLYIYALDTNTVLNVKSDDIDSYSNFRFEYTTESGRSKSFTLPKSSCFIYNGKADNNITASDMTPEMGEITFIDNNSDGKYEVVFISSYNDYYVSSINLEDKKIIDTDSVSGRTVSLLLDNDSHDIDVLVYCDGEESDFESILKGSVISVCESKDKKLYTIYVGIDEAEGTVSSIIDDEVCIDGEYYKVSASYKKEIRVGDEGIFYLDAGGRIAGVKSINSDKRRFGFLWKAVDADGEINDEDKVTILEIYTTDSQYVTYECAERVTVDGVNRIENGKIADMLAAHTKDIIGYELNEDGKITLIDTPVVAEDDTVEPITDKNNNLMERYTESYRTYKSTYKSFVKYTGVDSMYLSPKAVFFGTGTSNKEDMDKDRIITMTSSSFWSDTDFRVRGFSTDSELVDVVVYTEQSKAKTSKGPALLVTAVKQAWDDGEIQYHLEGIRDGNADFSIPVEKGSAAETLAKQLVKGDVVVFIANLNGEVFDMCYVFNYADKTAGTLDSGLNSSRALYGLADKFEYNILWIGTAAQTQYYAVAGTRVYIYDTGSKTAQIGKADDIQQGQTVLARMANEVIKELIIYK